MLVLPIFMLTNICGFSIPTECFMTYIRLYKLRRLICVVERIVAHSDASTLRRFSVHGRYVASRHSGKASVNLIDIIAAE